MSDIIDRINKLLALASSQNEAESFLAAEKATELMLQYAITEDQLQGAEHKAEKPITSVVVPVAPKYSSFYQMGLAQAVAEANLCRVYYDGSGRLVKSYTIVGFPSQVELVESLSNKLRATMIHHLRLIVRLYRAHGEPAAGVVHGFCQGFIWRIHTRLQESLVDASHLPGADLVFAGHQHAINEVFHSENIKTVQLRDVDASTSAYVAGDGIAKRVDMTINPRLSPVGEQPSLVGVR